MSDQVNLLTWQEVLDQLLSFLPPSWRANASGKILKRLLVAFALSAESLYAWMAKILRLSIISTSEGGWLKALVAGMGMVTQDGIAASVVVRFQRYNTTDALSIPLGTQTGAVSGQIFATSIAATIPAGQSSINVPCRAIQAGVSGNVGAGQIISLITPVPGVDVVSNPGAAIGGSDGESDTQIKARLPKHLEMLHRATIPATEAAILTRRDLFPEVTGFITQRNFGVRGYFRGVLSDVSGGDLYRAINWEPVGTQGVYFVRTDLTEINGLVSAGFPCQRFGVPERLSDGEEIWRVSAFVSEVEMGNWRFCHEPILKRLYARADGRDLNTLKTTIVSGVVWRVLRELEVNWAANGVFCDVIVPFANFVNISLSYTLETGYDGTTIDLALRTTTTNYVAGLGLGVGLELEGLYSTLALVAGASGVLVTAPTANVAVNPDSVVRAGTVTVTRLN